MRQGDALVVDLHADTSPAWIHGFTGGQAGTVAFPGSAEPPWTLDLHGAGPAVDAMQTCVQANGISDVPPSFVAAAATAPPSGTSAASAVPSGYRV